MMDRRRYATGEAPSTGKLPTDVSPRVILSTRYGSISVVCRGLMLGILENKQPVVMVHLTKQ